MVGHSNVHALFVRYWFEIIYTCLVGIININANKTQNKIQTSRSPKKVEFGMQPHLKQSNPIKSNLILFLTMNKSN